MKLMVYGTLKRGWGNNRLLVNATFVGEAVSKKNYVLFDSGIPYAVPFTENEDTHPLRPIMGEVFEIDADQLRRCDALEGHPNWYRREIINVEVNGHEEEVFIYEMPEWQGRARVCNTVDDYYKWG